MLTRRLIRIKVFKVLYSGVMSDSMSVQDARKNLMYSCGKTLDLYYFMLNLSVALRRMAELKVEAGHSKFHKTEADINPNLKFINNRVLTFLAQNETVMSYCDEKGLNWTEDRLLFVRKLFTQLQEKEYFRQYMSNPESSVEEDCELVSRIYEELDDNQDLDALLEDESLYWMDDLGFVLNNILNHVRYFSRKQTFPEVDVFTHKEDENGKDDKGADDRNFAVGLMDACLLNYSKYFGIVSSYVKNWDPDRIINTDVVLIIQGIAEAVRFDNIPVKVTINEYVEISKFFSSAKSKIFVNGLLDRIIQGMLSSGEIVKTGMGLC